MTNLLTSVLPQPRTTILGKINIPFPNDKISEFTPSSLELLTQLLSRAPGQLPSLPWFHDQSTLLHTFPPCLLHPKSSGIIPRLAASLSSLKLGEKKAILCPAHKPLNPYLIREIFLELTAECTTRLAHLTPAATASSADLPLHIQELVARMQKLNSTWMQPDIYRQAYQVSPSTPRYERIASGCEACILATIGGDRTIVRDLLASILGRRKKNRVMEGWIDVVRAWGSWQEDSDALTLECTNLGREIGRCRKQRHVLRRAARRAATREQLGGTINPFARNSDSQTLNGRDSLEEEQDEKGDVENEIVDFYANMMSQTSLALNASSSSTQNLHPEEGVHPAFRGTMIFTGDFFQNASRAVHEQERRHSVYSRSEYNTSQISHHGAAARASAYRKLVGDEENVESDEDEELEFTNPFVDLPTLGNRPAYRGSQYENPRAYPAPPSPRTVISIPEDKSKHKPAPRHRRPEPQENPFARKSHVAHSEGGRHGDRETRISDFMQ
ncbi:hypothetical protein SBOR_5825 [Sclerotinia borealis F-4128]|uniref:Uncharacterized protein n=1 Tax=Sclerotinia borealis (strain F-4128) TaxID=1432307 RepID=W9CD84_SCLBF|nr:hypothetical protein SBOR_5825 [Sclerotinia borealis F-4128]